MNPVSLRCEYKENPLGVGAVKPRLSWKLEAEEKNQSQSAYQILAASSQATLAADQGDVWDSGKVASSQSVLVSYAGKPLNSAQRIHWKLRVWDQEGKQSPWSSSAFWELGLLKRDDWSAKWIGSAQLGGPRSSVPCPYVRKSFQLEKSVASARLYVTALGLYEFHINGQRVGNDVFTPGWTDYHKRVQVQAYDVTPFLRHGGNAVGAILGDGWYCGHTGWQARQTYGDRPKLLAQIAIRYADGSSEFIASNATWKTRTGPMLESDLLMGESYDARQELPGWDEAGFNEAGWADVEIFPDVKTALVSSPTLPVRVFEELEPISEPRQVGGKWIFDMGQNMVGRVRLKTNGLAGTTLTLRHAEILKPDGGIYTENLRTAKQTDHYTLKGGAEEIWEPRFTFHGFRYVELSGLPGPASRKMITGVVLHSDMEATGSFECSDPLINQLQHNIQWGQKGNFLEVPTDCPQRDERLGWTGDAQVFVGTAAFNREVAPFFTKWLRDMDDAQSAEGCYPMYAPNIKSPADADGGPAWADAAVICAWNIYLAYGDKGVLEEHYPALERFMAFLEKNSKDRIRCLANWGGWEGFGDWLSINAETPKDLIGTAFFAYSARLMARVAGALGKAADALKYDQLFGEVRQAFQQRFVTQAGLVVGQTQTAYILALHFDLLPEALRPTAVTELVRDVRAKNTHLSAGFVGSPYLPHVLSRFGELDTAYALLFQKTWPSWLYPVTQGATTIWERWDGWTHDKGFQSAGMNSFNHYAYGAIGQWLYSVVAGLEPDPAQPGYKHILLRPQPGGNLSSAKVSYESVYGRIVSDWKITDEKFSWNIEIPPNCTATATLPGKNPTVHELGSGTYSFSAQL
jgi:alpha-L-rhamnosidase